MRYSAQHKSETRQRILEAAARQVRSSGPEGVSLGQIMQAEGLTNGGFYKHFASKDDLIVGAVCEAFSSTAESMLRLVAGTKGKNSALCQVIEFYLSEQHLDNPQVGCAFAALGPDLARFPDNSRKIIGDALDLYRERLQSLMPGATDEKRASSFLVLFPSMAGCLMAARLHSDPGRRTQMLAEARTFFIGIFCKEAAESE